MATTVGVSVQQIDLRRGGVFPHGNAEGIPPVRRVHRHGLFPFHSSIFIRFLDLRQEGLRAGQVKHVQLFALVIDAGTLQLNCNPRPSPEC